MDLDSNNGSATPNAPTMVNPEPGRSGSASAWAHHGFAGEPSQLLAEGTLLHATHRRWVDRPESIAFVKAPSPSGDLRTWTANECYVEVAQRCAALRSRGITHGTRVLMSCTPSVELILSHLSVLLCGATVVPVNTGFTAAEVRNIANTAHPSLAIMNDVTRWSDDSVNVITLDDLARDAVEHRTRTDPAIAWHTSLDDLQSDDPALLLFTSGTTGAPKGALLSHANALSSAQALVIAWEWTAHDRLLLCLPLFHMHGLGVGVHGTLVAGASAVVLDSFSEDAVFAAVAHMAPTMLFGVPTMWTRLADDSRVAELQKLRLCVSGSAALTPEVWNKLRMRADQQVLERYGMTETVMLASNPYRTNQHLTRRPGSVGFALPGVDIALHQPGPDGVGEIIVNGPNVFDGYLDRPDANAEAFLDGAWFRTGDLGTIDDSGYVTIVGRSKDLVITGGYNVYPSDVEEVLRQHPQVIDAAVVGEVSELWGETVAAFVIPNFAANTIRIGDGSGQQQDTDAELNAELLAELLDFSADHLASYQRPRRIVLCTDFPRNALGKVVKSELRSQLTDRTNHPR
jgi:malonyl-CoA/methylmalonyl-CoA synthetase